MDRGFEDVNGNVIDRHDFVKVVDGRTKKVIGDVYMVIGQFFQKNMFGDVDDPCCTLSDGSWEHPWNLVKVSAEEVKKSGIVSVGHRSKWKIVNLDEPVKETKELYLDKLDGQ